MNLSRISSYLEPYRILDIGANIGQFHQLAKYYYPSSYIFSVEASPDCEPDLKLITDNYYIGLLAKDNNEYDFYSRKETGIGTGNSIYRELTQFYSDEQIDIIKQPGIKLDDLFTDDTEFDLIKIDTQGSELDIISGGMQLCKKAKAILLEVSLTQYNEGAPLYDEVMKFMENIGFKPVEILDESRNHGAHQQDILFIKNKLKIYDTCWGKYAVHYYAQDLQKSLSSLVDTELDTCDLTSFKGISDLNNLEGSSLIVENLAGKFIIFDWGDSYEVNQGVIKLVSHPDCLGYYNSQPSNAMNNLETYIPHLEFKYDAFNTRFRNHYRNSFNELKNQIYFNGEITDIRTKNNKFLREQTYKNHPEFVILSKTDFDTYLKDIFEYKIIYSPAGGGDFAHRDMETFALGIPVIRQKYISPTTTLVAGVHYIDIDSVTDFSELLSNKELLCTIGENGRMWYEQNCLYPGNVDNMKQLIKEQLL